MKPIGTTPSLTERVYRAIADDILDGAFAPGEHLLQEQLATELGVSRHPVQQAMALLKTDGLVEEKGKRGLVVAGLDLARMRHHYDIRAVLDAYAARAAALAVRAGNLSAEAVRLRTESILAAGSTAASAGPIRDQIRHDEAFHKLIYELSGNPVLMETAEPNWRFLRRAMADVLRYAEPPKMIWEQHRGIVKAIITGDPDRAATRAAEHIRLASGRLSGVLEDRLAPAGSNAGEAS